MEDLELDVAFHSGEGVHDSIKEDLRDGIGRALFVHLLVTIDKLKPSAELLERANKQKWIIAGVGVFI